MASPSPIDNPELYDRLTLAGVKSPGIVTLAGHDRKINWDVKEGNAQSGGTTTLKGIPPIAFTATFSLVIDPSQGLDENAEWDEFQKVIDATVAGPTPKAVDIYHPDLARNGIKSVCKATVGGMKHDGKGGQSVVVTFQEYKPPKKKGGSPSGSAAKKPGTGADPNAAALAELDALTKRYRETPWS